MAARTARKRKATPRPARPRPATARPHAPGPGTTLRAPTSKAVTPGLAAPGLAAPRGMSLPAGLVPRGRVEALVPASPVPHPAGDGDADAGPEVLRPVVTATYWVDPGEHGMPYESVIRFSGRRGGVTGSWAGMVAAGLAVALPVLVTLLARVGVGGSVLVVALAASLAGAAGARGWYVMLQRGKVSGLPTRGLCIQGFIAGAVVAGIPGLLLAGIPAGTFFDAAAPGVFFAMAIGRQGCFLTGCCAGRPTASRWGIWSSDGRIGARRIPAQQLE